MTSQCGNFRVAIRPLGWAGVDIRVIALRTMLRGGPRRSGQEKAPVPGGPGLLSGDRSGAGQASTYTIHDTPKRSATMPKLGEKNVLANGIFTCPPSLRAPKSRSASASLGAVSDSAKP